ncbi:hypothetical protein [Rhizobium sp. R693]|uniref:hypothetical protein n=1 Tax=Rhizobium sp. R693 TaxID=1764276 RepID=UPI000B534D48|nr:hypothetical protein [Rhizobium sp. R693]OWV96823.1 hypothetical protein ATY79_24065 [Rhizobium sp. R693]
MSHQNGKETTKTADVNPALIERAASSHLPSLTLEQQHVINAYRLGQMEEWLFQQHLADDPVLAAYVRRICRGFCDER